LRRITTDHSHVQELVDDGQLTDDEAAVHPMRNIVTRSVGNDAHVEVDVFPIELQVDDRILLCSDGLTDMVHEDTIAAELRREPDPAVAAHKLVDTANAAGGVDNITVVVVAVTADDNSNGVAQMSASAAVEEIAVARVVDEPDEPERGGVTPVETPSRRERRAQRRGTAEPGRRSRRVKTTLWVLAVLVVIGVALGAIAYYARNTYYVAFSGSVPGRQGGGTVTVFKGTPGGLLWWDPTVERATTLARDDLRAADVDAVASEKTFSSSEDADAFVARMRARAEEKASALTTTTTPPTTTLPDATTTTVAGP
jgi:protein phosphatase